MTDNVDDTTDDTYEPPGPEASSKAKKRRGRPRNENYLSFDEAREFVRSELLPSRGKFFEWWDRNKPKAIPRFPYRVYPEWISWNDFLGTSNKFNDKIGTKWRSIEEACVWVHTLKVSSYNEWMEYCRTHELPEDIPARPDLVYNGWRSWNHWLGNRPVEATEAKMDAQKIQVFYIIHEPGTPENVFTFGVESMGITALKQRHEHDPFTVIRLFWHDPLRYAVVKQIIDMNSTPYLGSDKQRIVPNVWEIIWHIQMQLEMITRV